MNIQTQGWQDLQVSQPIDPKSVIKSSVLGTTAGTFARSITALQAAWGSPTFAYSGNNTKVVSWDVTDAATSQDAVQWAFAHQMVNVGANIPIALNSLAFLRAGAIMDNQIEFAFGGSTFNNVQLTFRDNIGTSGQFLNAATGSVPVISYGSGFTGNTVLHISFFQPGVYQMVLIAQVGAGAWVAFPMEWVVIP
jgi:hypothetical protein